MTSVISKTQIHRRAVSKHFWVKFAEVWHGIANHCGDGVNAEITRPGHLIVMDDKPVDDFSWIKSIGLVWDDISWMKNLWVLWNDISWISPVVLWDGISWMNSNVVSLSGHIMDKSCGMTYLG